MRYCYNCSRITAGQPHFCTRCGRSYDAKLCPRLHPNPRDAAVCSECGSRDLTTPQPKLPFWLRPLLVVLSVLPGIVLLGLSVLFLVQYVYILIVHPSLQFPYMLLGLVLGLLWLLYMELPRFFRNKARRRIRNASKE